MCFLVVYVCLESQFRRGRKNTALGLSILFSSFSEEILIFISLVHVVRVSFGHAALVFFGKTA